MLSKNWLRRGFYFLSYLRKPPWDTGVSPPELMEFLRTHPPGNALDLGCGTGTNIITLAQHGWQVTGIDYIPAAIRKAERKIRKAGVSASLSVGDVTRLDHLRGPFDLILDIGCYHNLNETEKISYEAYIQRLLLQAGTFLLYGFLITPERGFGIGEADILRLSQAFVPIFRQDGKDQRRPSTWLSFQKLA